MIYYCMSLIKFYKNDDKLIYKRRISRSINAIKTDKRGIKLWETPVYFFRVLKETIKDLRGIELTIDVTKSTPSQSNPARDLKSCLSSIFLEYPKIKKIVDFGAGNFKNIPYLLEKEKTVFAVDFESVLIQKQTQKIKKKCERYNERFRSLIFPDQFLKNRERFDFALLAHVLPVMPVFAERLMVLQLLYRRIKNKGFILWHSQKEDSNYKKKRVSRAYICGDGIWLRRGRFHTFFKVHHPPEIDEIMLLSGFRFIKSFKCSMGYLRLFQKINFNIFYNIISPVLIDEFIQTDSTNFQETKTRDIIVNISDESPLITPNPPVLELHNRYLEKLRVIGTGRGHSATEFHRLSAIIFYFSLYSQLTDMNLEKEINQGRQRIDVTFSNRNNPGFFKHIKEVSDVKCPIISVECKNYSSDIGNPELFQLSSRLNERRGFLGFLLCRKIEDRTRLNEILIDILKDSENKKHIIVLDEEDLEEMLSYGLNLILIQ